MTTLVPIESIDGVVGDDSLGIVSSAATLGDPVVALIFGAIAADTTSQVAAHGASRILVAENPVFADPLAAPRIAMIEAVCTNYSVDLVLAPTTTINCDVMSALAVRLAAGLAWGLSGIELRDGVLVGLRPVQTDSLVAETVWNSPMRLGLVRPYAMAPVSVGAAEAAVEFLHIEVPAGPIRIVERTTVQRGEGPSLATAEIVVSGGRGMGSADKLDLIRELASALGGAAGVSLPVVEAGWAPRSMQVGQTGTVVRPRLYMAFGISGQIQHRVGMERSGAIVAINSDPTAPIMGFCDLAVVASVESILPRLTDLISEQQGTSS